MSPQASPPPPSPAAAWLAAARPKTLPVGATPVCVATALAWADGRARGAVFGCALLGALAIQIGTNLFNDWADGRRGADGPDRLGPLRVTQSGALPAGRVLAAALAAFAVAAAFGVALIALGGPWILGVGLASIVAGLAYTGGPAPLAYHGLGDLFAFVFFGPVAVVATYRLHVGATSAAAWAQGCALGAFSAAVLAVNNLRDRHGDARVGKRTLAVRLGGRATRLQYTLLLTLPYGLAVALAWGADGGGRGPAQPAQIHWPWLLPWLTAPAALALGRSLWRHDGAALNAVLAATARLEVGFGALICVAAALLRG